MDSLQASTLQRAGPSALAYESPASLLISSPFLHTVVPSSQVAPDSVPDGVYGSRGLACQCWRWSEGELPALLPYLADPVWLSHRHLQLAVTVDGQVRRVRSPPPATALARTD